MDLIHTIENCRKIEKANRNLKRLFPDFDEKIVKFKDAISEAQKELDTHSPMTACIELCNGTEDGILQMWLLAAVWDMLPAENFNTNGS